MLASPSLAPRAWPRLAPLGLALALACVSAIAACTSTPDADDGRPGAEPRAAATEPAIVPLDTSRRRFMFTEAELDDPVVGRMARRERELWEGLMLPLRPATAGDLDDMHRGLAVADVLTRMFSITSRDEGMDGAYFTLDVRSQAGITGFIRRGDLFASEAERNTWLATPGNELPSGLNTTAVRWLVGGQLLPAETRGGPRRAFIWLMDRLDQKLWSGTTDIDLPRLVKPRLLLLRLVTDAGMSPRETERGDMVWTEDIDDRGLVAMGKAAVALAWGDDAHTAPIEAVVEAAPWSYTAWLIYARHFIDRGGGCDGPVRKALDRALSINPHADFGTTTHAFGCTLDTLFDGQGGEMFESMARSGATSCAVAGKAIAAVGGGREVPGAGFLAGLGGFYRNSTCKSGHQYGLVGLAEKATDPFVAAGLWVDAGVAAIGEDDLDGAEARFGSAIASIRSMPEPRACLPELYIAEAELHLAGLMLQRSQPTRGREHVAQAERIAARCHDERLVARARNTLGLIEQANGQYAKALDAFTKALKRFQALGDEMNVAVAHLNIGWTRALIGQKEKALPDLERALVLKRRIRSDGGVAVVLENLGVTLMTMGRFAEAEPLFVEARELATDPTSRAAILNNLARIRAGQGRHDEASALLVEARQLAISAHARTLEAQIEQTKGGIEAEQQRHAPAFEAFNQALVIRREVGDRAGEGLTLSSLMTVAGRMGKPTLAIVYGKLAIAAHQEVQAAARAIDKEAELAFLRSREATYRQLAELLVNESRLIEAERVLALLKIDEANDWTRSAEASGAVPLTPAELLLERDYQRVADKVMSIGREHGALATKFPLTAGEEKRLEALRKQLEKANQQFGKFLESLADRKIEARGLDELREGVGIGPDLAELEPGTVAVYTLLTKDRYHAIVVSADATVAESVSIQGNMLNVLVSELRRALQDPRSDPRPIAKELYDVLIAPIVKHLDGAQAKTVMWSLDRALRYVPIGALWDGERWVAERWANAIFTPASRARLKDKPVPAWRVLAAGVSRETEGFSPLPGVKDELAAIVDDVDTKLVEGVLPGVVLLDAAFERNAFLSLLGRKWPVVHIASHFAFEPGNKDASFLVLGEGRLSVAELENMPNLFQGVDLLSLSACNTATGDSEGEVGREVESFAVLAQRKGARAVLATLWPVADRSTSVLMQRFYALHKGGGLTKLAALRQAQDDLLSGKLTAPAATDPDRGPRPLAAPSDAAPAADVSGAPTPPSADWTHPYYWAPFVLIGNTL